LIWRITPQQSERDQRRAAANLRAQGLTAGDRVALIHHNSPALLAVILGALRTGIVPVLLHPGLLAHERALLLDDADPALTIDDDATLRALTIEGPEAELHDVPRARPMHYTSGTSGRPKGVWSGILDDADAQALFDDEARIWRFTPDDTTLICSPLYHSVAVRFAATTLLSGGSVVLLDRFHPDAVLDAITTHRPTAGFMVPAHLQRVFSNDRPPTPDDLASFRLLVHAGAPCPEPLKRRAIDAFPPGAVWEFYGSTEGQFTVCSPEDWEARPGTVGRARPSRRIEIDAEGQIWCHAPPFARFEYWRDPAKTSTTWTPDGSAFTVGDLGRLDDDGFLYLDGRRDDLIISGGVNVYPAEVEQALAHAPGVREVAVFGVPDERWGSRVCAAVIGTATASDVMAHAEASLAGHKRPKEVFMVDDLPRTVTGKVRRTAVAEWLGLG
jgi:acyl-CoA synthetase (AMP-forming)/AMP-acid ligase II